MSERPWYKRYPSDFIAGTVGMTLELKGAYSLILDVIYDRGGPVPDDVRYWAGLCNVSVRKWQSLRDELVALGKIAVVDGFISNSRARKEIENAEKTAKKLSESGAKGGRKRAENLAASFKNNDIDQASPETLARAPVQKPESREERSSNDDPKKEPNRRGTRLDAGWRLPTSWGQWALTNFPGTAEAAVRAEADKFRDYWISKTGQSATKLDWEATWRNWCRTAFSALARNGKSTAKPATRTMGDVARELLEEMENGNSAAPDENYRAAIGRLPPA